ncbi:PREDICTED: premnaspirodiene oxygenase-like [Erythranthe guttata]|nr:PREDICTED: premnaspirodiene oxygenase-like [Erythranthe guttata]|eukprot:XP_012856043.1 PREDICTED: premnaspirodiene oxygenase-like [Erythranthe guttata]
MDLQFQSLPILVSVFIPIFVVFFFFFSRLRTKKSTRNLPPGPWKLPLIGNMHNLIGSLPHIALHELALIYGPVMHLQLGELSSVIISSPDAAKQVMKTHDINFASRPSIIVTEILSYNCTNVGFSEYGDYWRQLRKICTLELLSMKRVSSFRSIREEAFLDLARWLLDYKDQPAAVNLTEKLYSCAYSLISRATFGKKSEANERLLSIIKEGIVLAAGFNVADVYPSIKLLQMMSGLRRKVKKLHGEADCILDDIIHEHRYSKNEKQTSDIDLLDVLLRFQGGDDGIDIPLTTDNIKAVIMDMLGGGSETSATTLDWAMAEMLKNPRILEKAQDEVRRFFDDKGGYVDESRIHELKYLMSIIKETLRIHAPLPLLLPRKCRDKCEINGYEIPVDTKIIVNAWAINRDPKYWRNPDCFEPERFLDEDLEVDYKGNHFEYIPFGAGRRICPGIAFGMANVELPLAMFLYHFDWKLPPGMKHEELDMSESFGVTARRNNNLFVVPVIKRPLPPSVK